MISVPIVLFAYDRPEHLRRTLNCLRVNRVPLIHAFSDAPKTSEKEAAVEQVRRMLRAVDWCELRLVERDRNLGLGLSVRTGVTDVFRQHEAIIVFEDDLVCVPGSYDWLCAAMERYREDPRVMSVTGWTHPRVTPSNIGVQPYFDGRSECLVWGAWRRSWQGMERSALEMIRECKAKGIDPCRYGADLVAMAQEERTRNIWAVRFLYNHIRQGTLCLRPPWSMVEHIGFDASATNSSGASWIQNPPLRPCPPVLPIWPEPVEHKDCAPLMRAMCGERRATAKPGPSAKTFAKARVKELLRAATPPAAWSAARRLLRFPPLSPDPSAEPPGQPEWEYIPEGWLYPLAESQGWAAEGIRSVQRAKWPRFAAAVVSNGPLGVSHEALDPAAQDVLQHNAAASFGYVLALTAWQKKRLRILDWGGGLGHFYLLARALHPQLELEYHCKDLPLLADEGRTLLPEVHFHTDDECLREQYDLIVVSGALQYVRAWKQFVPRLAQAAAPHLYVALTPTVEHCASFVFIQRPPMYGTAYLGWCFNRSEIQAECAASGLSLVREFLYGYRPVIAWAPEQNEYRGFLFTTGKDH